ncbi:unnamed protein product, partial [Citrullus colocynthis]
CENEHVKNRKGTQMATGDPILKVPIAIGTQLFDRLSNSLLKNAHVNPFFPLTHPSLTRVLFLL